MENDREIPSALSFRLDRLTILHNAPAPYRKELFSAFSTWANSNEVEFTVIHLTEREYCRSWNVELEKFERVLIPFLQLKRGNSASDFILNKIPWAVLKDECIICFGYNYPLYIFAIVIRSFLKGKKTYVFAEVDSKVDACGIFKKFLKKLIFRFIDKFFVPSETSMLALKRLHADAKVECVGNPVSNIFLAPREAASRSTKISDKTPLCVCMVSRLESYKNVIETVKLFQEFRSPLQFTIVGEGPLDSQVKALILNDSRFLYIEALSPSDLRNLYDQSDVLVLLSSYEPWGMVAVEAACRGCVCLLSKAITAAEIIPQSLCILMSCDCFDNVNSREIEKALKAKITRGGNRDDILLVQKRSLAESVVCRMLECMN